MEKHYLWYRHIAIKMLACGLLYGVFTSCSGNGEVTSVVSANMLKSARYTVTANGKPVEVYKAALNINVANITLSGVTEVVVKAKDAGYWNEGAKIRPLSQDIIPEISGDTLIFSLDKPAMLSVERKKQIWDHVSELGMKRDNPDWWKRGFRYNETLQLSSYATGMAEALFIFADTLQAEPKRQDATIRLLPGIHTGNIDLRSGQHLHLDEGAFLFGSVNIWDAENVKVTGKGVIIHDGNQPPYTDRGFQTERNWRPISINNSQNVSVSGVTCIARSRTWTIQATASRNLEFDGLKIIASNLANLNGDGIDLCGAQDVIISNCFFRTCDDAIALYRTMPFDDNIHETWGEKDYSQYVDTWVKNVFISGCVFWNTSANVMRVGWTGMSLNTENITMKDCDVIHLSDCSYFYAPHSLLNIMSEDGSGEAEHSDYLFENIRMEEYSALVGINHQQARLKNICFKDIYMVESSKWPSLIIVHNVDEDKGIIFENVTVKGKLVEQAEDLPLCIEGDGNIEFR